MPTEAIYEQLAKASSPEEVKSILGDAKAEIVYSDEGPDMKVGGGGPPDNKPPGLDNTGDLGEDMKLLEGDAKAADSGPPKKKGLKDFKKDAIDKAMPEGF